LDRQNITSSTVTINRTIARRTYPTILRVEDLCFLDDGELLSRAVDPPEELEGELDGEGVPEDEGDDGVCVGVEPVGVEEGDAEGAMLVLNGFPSFLKFGTFSNFGGTGPENKLFSIFLFQVNILSETSVDISYLYA
jgi:hypothetical protein